MKPLAKLEAIELRKTGMKSVDIAHKLGVSKNSVSAWTKSVAPPKSAKYVAAEYLAKRYRIRRALTDDIKVSAGCVDCDYNAHPEALHFDHVERVDKQFRISTSLSRTWGNVLKEIAKCVVRCANCHAIKTKREHEHAGCPRKPTDVSLERRRNRNRSNGKKKYQGRRELVDSIKTKTGCIDCGFNVCAEALQFDHLDKKSKAHKISEIMCYKLETVLQEISKCVIRCANCHAVKTAINKDNLRV